MCNAHGGHNEKTSRQNEDSWRGKQEMSRLDRGLPDHWPWVLAKELGF